MNSAVQHVLAAFDQLKADEKREAASEILKRAMHFDYPVLDDETLAQIADETFQEYDAREAADAF